MKIESWDADSRGIALKVNRVQALRIISSLANQLMANSSDVGREEFWVDAECNLYGSREYFSIFLVDDEESK